MNELQENLIELEKKIKEETKKLEIVTENITNLKKEKEAVLKILNFVLKKY